MSIFADKDVSLMRNTEQVMVISHNFLICANKHYCEVVRFVLRQLVEFEHGFHIVQVHELINDTVGIACNVT
jgi:hypothetical protein